MSGLFRLSGNPVLWPLRPQARASSSERLTFASSSLLLNLVCSNDRPRDFARGYSGPTVLLLVPNRPKFFRCHFLLPCTTEGEEPGKRLPRAFGYLSRGGGISARSLASQEVNLVGAQAARNCQK